jgi:REP element-mobilizing transposase RayT
MSRPLRIEYPDAWYHVMNRGRRGESTFTDRKDHQTFLAVLKECSELFAGKVAAYCLMSNHYHVLIQTPDANISRIMRHLNGVYTQRYNRRRKTDGQLFRGRYKSVLVEEDSHLLEILRYIHLNPVRAKMCSSVGDYAWSSHPAYLAGGEKWQWLETSSLLAMFSSKIPVARNKYSAFVQDGDSTELLDFFSKKNLSPLLGSDSFITWIKERFFEEKQHGEIPQSHLLAPSIDEIKKVVCHSYGITEKALAESTRGRINEPRNLALFLARKLSRQKLQNIAIQFGLGSYSSVSSIVMRTEKLLLQDRNLAATLENIREKLSKSQAKT